MECKSKIKLIKTLCRQLKAKPWDDNLRLKVLHERKSFKKMTRKKHRLHKRYILEKMNRIEANDSSSFWNFVDILKYKQENNTSSNISPKEWHDYIKYLMNTNQENNFEAEVDLRYKKNNNDMLNTKIAQPEVINALTFLKRKKSCGPDNILNEMLIISCRYDVDVITNIFNAILKTGIYPDSWRRNLIKPIFKSGSVNDPSNYRGIALTSCLGKLYARVLYNRLNDYADDNSLICIEQIGFRKVCRTSDHILTLKTIIDQAFKKKTHVHACFIDFKKAFDLVNI